MTTFLKFVHLAAIALWSGGLIALPFLFWQRRTLEAGWISTGCTAITRLVYVELTSPAAFIAIGSGTALIFLQATFAEWFSLKMVLVGIMAMLHVVAGLVLHAVVLARGPLQPAFLRGADERLCRADRRNHLDRAGQAAHRFEPVRRAPVRARRTRALVHQSFGEIRMPTP